MRESGVGLSAVAVLGMVLFTGCAAAQPTVAQPGVSATRLPRASMEQIAATLGCARPSMQVDAAELRQAVCQVPQGRYTMVTFTTDDGKRAWLKSAQAYGGAYLVGDRWTVIAEPALLEGLRGRLGGEVETAAHH